MTDPTVYSYYDDDENVVVAGPAVKPPRRRLSSHLPVRFAPAVLASARQLAIQDGLSISAWVRWLVEQEVLRRTPAKTESNLTDWTFDGPTPETRTAPATDVVKAGV
jgi:hypothetical protein